jgi:hypothetical protein
MTQELFALLLAGALMVPSIKPAGGGESTVGLGTEPQANSWGTAQPVPVPHLDATPWVSTDTRLNDPKVEILTDLQLDTLGPFLVEPAIPPRRISPSAAPMEE